MDTDFTDIKIVSLEDEMTVVSPEHPSLFQVFFKLLQTPPPLWQKHFKDQRKIARHPHWRRAWLDRKFIVVECLPAEIETYHLNDLRQDVAKANQLFREYLAQKPKPDHHREHSERQERERLREMKGRLSFD